MGQEGFDIIYLVVGQEYVVQSAGGRRQESRGAGRRKYEAGNKRQEIGGKQYSAGNKRVTSVNAAAAPKIAQNNRVDKPHSL